MHPLPPCSFGSRNLSWGCLNYGPTGAPSTSYISSSCTLCPHLHCPLQLEHSSKVTVSQFTLHNETTVKTASCFTSCPRFVSAPSCPAGVVCKPCMLPPVADPIKSIAQAQSLDRRLHVSVLCGPGQHIRSPTADPSRITACLHPNLQPKHFLKAPKPLQHQWRWQWS